MKRLDKIFHNELSEFKTDGFELRDAGLKEGTYFATLTHPNRNIARLTYYTTLEILIISINDKVVSTISEND